MSVNRIRTSVVLGAVLLWAVTPAMACLLPGFALTPAERECCHHMAGHCGQSVMPASHTCCQAPTHPAALSQAQADLPLKNAIAGLPISAYALSSAVTSTFLRSPAFVESPPGRASWSSSVLRI
jgi:hypothetical protein